jgi:hypothetical protein
MSVTSDSGRDAHQPSGAPRSSYRPGRVRVSAPLRTSLHRLRLFTISKLGWIKREDQQRHVIGRRAAQKARSGDLGAGRRGPKGVDVCVLGFRSGRCYQDHKPPRLAVNDAMTTCLTSSPDIVLRSNRVVATASISGR